MKRLVIILLAGACAALPAKAQELVFGGRVMNNDIMMSTDFAELSRTHNFGTARSMGMGGAFTSLGADISSMSINPAGLGMYRRSEVTITPFLSIARANTDGTSQWESNGKTRFTVANVGAAFNVYERSSGLTSLTLGVGMNRIADFNSRYSYLSESRYDYAHPNNLMPTIADLFAQQLGQDGVFPDSEGRLGYGNTNPWYWPAILGYNGYMISPYNTPGGRVWTPDTIGRNASVLHATDVVSSGSINEFALSLGGNVNNILYFGATLGIHSVRKETDITYMEEYGYFDAAGNPTKALDSEGKPLQSQIDYAGIYQQSVVSGAGVNLKLGVIVRPIAGLRVGLAYHSPTYYSLNRSYYGSVSSLLHNNDTGDDLYAEDITPVVDDSGGNSWSFWSPSRLLAGVSYTFGSIAVVSLDYQRDWYNGIRVNGTPESNPAYAISNAGYKDEFKGNYQATNTVRAGIELKPIPMLALRAGGGYTDSMVRKEPEYDYIGGRALNGNAPMPLESYYFSGGVGVALSRSVSLDVAYQYFVQKNTPYQLFYSAWTDTGEMQTYSGLYDTTQKRHFISATLAVRF